MPAHWQGAFSASRTDIGRIMFFILAGTGFSMYMAGKLQERFSFPVLIFTGSLMVSLAMFFVARADTMTDIYIWGFVSGFFCGFIYVPLLTLTQVLFADRAGLVAGIINLTFGGAAAVFSPFFSFILVRKGPVTATDISAAAALCLGTSVALLVRMPAGEKKTGPVKRPVPGNIGPLSLKQTLVQKSFWCLWFVWAFAGAAGISMIVLSSAFGRYLGYGISSFVYILVGFNIMNGIGRLVCGRLSDSLPMQKILMTCFIVSGGAYLLMGVVRHLAGVSVLAALVGLSFGAMFAVSAPLVSRCFGIGNFGRIFGLVFTAYGFVAGVLGPWVSGMILDRYPGGFPQVFIYFALLYFISAVLITRVRPLTAADGRD